MRTYAQLRERRRREGEAGGKVTRAGPRKTESAGGGGGRAKATSSGRARTERSAVKEVSRSVLARLLDATRLVRCVTPLSISAAVRHARGRRKERVVALLISSLEFETLVLLRNIGSWRTANDSSVGAQCTCCAAEGYTVPFGAGGAGARKNTKERYERNRGREHERQPAYI